MKILYSDPHLIIVNKPGGLLSVPGRGPDKQDCVVSRIKKLFPDCIPQPAVHRLDMATSGIMLLAQTIQAHKILSQQFIKRSIEKKYVALLESVIEKNRGKIELAFRLDPNNRPYQIYDPIQGKVGVSYWRKLQEEGNNTRIEFTPVTGRTHQLRLHASHKLGLDSPIVGDSIYGKGKEGDQMMLHASFISFLHPEDMRPMEFLSAPLF